MSDKKNNFSRRDFLKTAGAVGLGSVLSPMESFSSAKAKFDADDSQPKMVPTRPFGRPRWPRTCKGAFSPRGG